MARPELETLDAKGREIDRARQKQAAHLAGCCLAEGCKVCEQLQRELNGLYFEYATLLLQRERDA